MNRRDALAAAWASLLVRRALQGSVASVAPASAQALQPPDRTAPSSRAPVANPSAALRVARTVDWDELLPPSERGRPIEAPEPVHDYLGEDGPAMKQTGSFVANPKLHGAQLRIPGFIVPLVLSRDGRLGEGFLVPYYGACIHVPPPPPNQIVYLRCETPQRIVTIFDAYWITGRMQVARKATRMASAVYSLAVQHLVVYS